MAQAKARKEREEKRTAQEIALQKTVDTISKIEKRTEAQTAQLKTARAALAPLRFQRLAVPRVSRAIKAIESVGKLTGAGYKFTPEQADKCIKALQDAVELAASKFQGTVAEASGFSL